MHILVAHDGSVESRNALTNALDILDVLDGRVTVVHSVPAVSSDSHSDDVDVEQEEHAEAILAEAVERAESHDAPVDTALLHGDPIDVIPAFAQDQDVNVIYVGHRGLQSDLGQGEHRGPLGSVARGITENTDIPVTVFDRSI